MKIIYQDKGSKTKTLTLLKHTKLSVCPGGAMY